MRFYVASGLENRDKVHSVIQHLIMLGHQPSYDWTQHGDVRGDGQPRMREVSVSETSGIISSELVLIMLPGGKGTHIELGLALASCNGKRIMLWSETGAEFVQGAGTCVFYHHPSIEQICCDIEQLYKLLAEL
ncbi:MAG: hypothetical protein RR232_01745 [Clostridia bacterium]